MNFTRGVSTEVVLESSLKVFKNCLKLSLPAWLREGVVLLGAFSVSALVLGWLNTYVVVGREVTTCHLDRVELRSLKQDLGSVPSQV